MATAATAGWRVMTLGARTTSFLIFGTEYVVVCYERRIDSPPDQSAVLSSPAPPTPPLPPVPALPKPPCWGEHCPP
jgi:hypothetical protein